jgi:hypothetical protein
MSTKDKPVESEKIARHAAKPEEDDTEGHGLLLDTDFYIQRKTGRDAEIEREARERRQIKESRPNKAERR